ncbi:hypothetical protein D7147_05555 [Micromonospora musae]|uniref:Low temperature requirement protein A n=1 Tax=Micromonospora musae TaxID=1894970 RepID=A0ABX9RG14_9ACTN|nr:low temperature requirement protein A [Micromonospora musae]RKN22634.1 hypothetical protein D7147_05555 [Micromonospora musae]
MILVTGLALGNGGFTPDGVAASVGAELVIANPLGRTPPAWIAVILGGPALYLAGRARFEHAVFGRVSRSRPIGILALAALAPAMFLLPPVAVAVAAAAALVLTGIAGADAARARRNPSEPPSPPGQRWGRLVCRAYIRD